MDLYHYHPHTGEYLGASAAEESPLEPGVWMIPAHCVTVAPPRLQPGQRAAWSQGAWSVRDPEPEPEPKPDPLPTPKEIARGIAGVVQAHLDAMAHSMGYESIHTAVTYADEPAVPRFQLDGKALREWRSKVWARCYELVDQYLAGSIDATTAEQVIFELPLFHPPVDPPPEPPPIIISVAS